jgi:hypothetical protein
MYTNYIYIINKIFKSLIVSKNWMKITGWKLMNISAIQKKILENHYLQNYASITDLDFNWFECDNIPENIDQIMKDIKNRDF